MKKRLSFLKKYADPYKALFLLLFVSVAITTVAGTAYPFIFGKMIDNVFYAKDQNAFVIFIVIYGSVFGVHQLFRFISQMSWANLVKKFLYDIRVDTFHKVLSYKGKKLTNVYSGDVVQRIGNDTNHFLNYIYYNVIYTITDIAELVIMLVLIFIISWPLGIVTLIFIPISVYTSEYFARKLRKIYKKVESNKGLLSSWLFEIIQGLQEVKLLNASKNVMSLFIGKTIFISRDRIRASKVEVMSERVNSGLSMIGQVSVFALASFLIFRDSLTVGEFVAIYAYFAASVTIFSDLNSKSQDIAENMVSIDRVIELFDEETEDSNANAPDLVTKDGKITFQDVCFSYDNKRKNLDRVTFEINAGEQISLVGRSGSGKSTLISLLTKLYTIDSGKILIDNHNIDNYNLKSLREQIGVVHQKAVIFNGTIRYNLIFSNNKDRDEEIWSALKMTHLYEYVKLLPNGLDTIIGKQGNSLSGGQKQRLVIARVFIKKPKILIFDEATSSLDSEAEEVIRDSWQELSNGRTIIIIAHRLSTILNSNKIAVLEDGKIVCYDSHQELINNCSTYIELFKEQFYLNEEPINNVQTAN